MTRPIILRSFFCAASALGFLVASAAAQPTLERLEDQIRRRTGQPAAEGRPDAAAQSRRPAARNANRQASGQLEPGYLGLVADDQNDRGRGVRVTSIHPGGPAEKAGVRRLDLITAMADIRVRQIEDMVDILSTFSAGQALEIEVLRDGKKQKVTATLGRRAEGAQPAPSKAADAPEAIPLPPGEVGSELPPEPAVPGSALAPPSDAVQQPTRDDPRIAQLQRRIEQLERRVAELERALGEKRSQP